MGLVFHIAEIAVLLAIAYAAGWGVGYGLHRLVARPQPVAAIPPERLAAVTGAMPPKDPSVKLMPDEVGSAPPPPDPSLEIPISPEALAALETPGAPVPPVATPARPPSVAARARAIEPAPSVEVVGPAPAQPTSRPGIAWGGARKGVEAAKFEPPVIAPQLVEAPVPEAAVVETPQPVAAEVVSPAVEIVPLKVVRDDAEAMRSIEAIGNPAAAVPVADAQAAVSAAQAAVEQMLARSGINPPKSEGVSAAAQGKPTGLPRPRDGVRDDLRRIAGIGPLDVNVLNNLGIFHFDQIASLDEREVLWLENHAFQRGRIGREGWQEQASTLADGGKERLRAPN